LLPLEAAMVDSFETQSMGVSPAGNGAGAAGETFPFEAGAAEGEADEFGRIIRRIGRRLRPFTPMLRRLVPMAVRAVGGGPAASLVGGFLREDEAADESEYQSFDLDLQELDEAEDLDEAALGEEEDISGLNLGAMVLPNCWRPLQLKPKAMRRLPG
jgi:hypothetical protein